MFLISAIYLKDLLNLLDNFIQDPKYALPFIKFVDLGISDLFLFSLKIKFLYTYYLNLGVILLEPAL